MNTISLKRIKLLLLADWYELKEYYLWPFIVTPVLFLALVLSDQVVWTNESLPIGLVIFLLLSYMMGVNYVTFRSNSLKGLGLLTPAKPAEKFVTQLIVLLFLFISSLAVFLITIGLSLQIGGVSGFGDDKDLILYALRLVFSTRVISLNLICLMLVHWLGCLTFKKGALFKSLLIVAGIIYAGANLNPFFFSYLTSNNGVLYETENVSCYTEDIYPGLLGILRFKILLFITFALTMLYIGYLKLKEKEQR